MLLRFKINEIVKDWQTIINSLVYEERQGINDGIRVGLVPEDKSFFFIELKHQTQRFLEFHDNDEYITIYKKYIEEYERSHKVDSLLKIRKMLLYYKELYDDILSNKVYIVNDQKNELIAETKDFLRQLGLEPIVLKDLVNKGQTIIEKIESNSDVAFAIVIYNKCEKGGENEDGAELKPRAHQNVVFEHGYLNGVLGRERVCALVEDGVEIPADLLGLAYHPIDKNGAWKLRVAKEMQAVGLDVDLNRF